MLVRGQLLLLLYATEWCAVVKVQCSIKLLALSLTTSAGCCPFPVPAKQLVITASTVSHGYPALVLEQNASSPTGHALIDSSRGRRILPLETSYEAACWHIHVECSRLFFYNCEVTEMGGGPCIASDLLCVTSMLFMGIFMACTAAL